MIKKRAIQVRVKRGADLLDLKCPGWEKKIHLGTLDMSSATHCVLGQLFTTYIGGVDKLLGIIDPANKIHARWVKNHGFNAWFDMCACDLFTALTKAWKYQINKRLAR